MSATGSVSMERATMGKTDDRLDPLENEAQFQEDRFIEADLLEQMLRETLEAIHQEDRPSETEPSSTTHPSSKSFSGLLTIRIGSTQVPAEQIQHYTEGDLIVLDQNLSEPITLTTPDNQRFQGKLGKIREHYAVRIVKPEQ